MNENEDAWNRLVDAAKTAPPDDNSDSPPTVSVKNLRESVQSLLLALTWRKWSLLAAIFAGILFLVFYYFFRDDPPAEESIIPTEPPSTPFTP